MSRLLLQTLLQTLLQRLHLFLRQAMGRGAVEVVTRELGLGLGLPTHCQAMSSNILKVLRLRSSACCFLPSSFLPLSYVARE